MRFSVTFPGTAEQATYLQDLITLMGEMRDGTRPTDEQLDRFRGLEALTNIEADFPCFDPDGYAITHDQVSGEISVYPAHRSAETDAEGFAYALRSMLCAYDRHEDIVTFSYAVAADKPYAGAYSGGAVVCTSYAWEITTTEDAENQLRKHAEQQIEDARIRALPNSSSATTMACRPPEAEIMSIGKNTYLALAERIGMAIRNSLTPFEFSEFADQLKVKERCIFAFKGGPIQLLYIIEDQDADRPTLRLDDILISESRRGAGIGTAIITAVKEFCAEEGFDLNLSANPLEEYGDPARPAALERLICYYERLGFTPEGRRCDGNMIIEAGGPDLSM